MDRFSELRLSYLLSPPFGTDAARPHRRTRYHFYWSNGAPISLPLSEPAPAPISYLFRYHLWTRSLDQKLRLDSIAVDPDLPIFIFKKTDHRFANTRCRGGMFPQHCCTHVHRTLARVLDT